MWKDDKDIMKKITDAGCPSGYETPCAEIFENGVKDYVDEVKRDVLGNRIGVINGLGDKKIMFSGHMDEIGLMVRYIDDKGFISFAGVGGVDPQHMMGQRVKIFSKDSIIYGVIGRKPIHLQKPEDREKAVKLDDMYIDIGASSKDEVLEKVAIGDVAVVDVKMIDAMNNRLIARAFDNKMGTYIVASTLREISKRSKETGKIPVYTVYGVATVQEEIGLRGAKTSAFGIILMLELLRMLLLQRISRMLMQKR